MQVQHDAGGTFRVGRVEREVTRDREIEIKESGGTRYCEICKGGPEVQIEATPKAYVAPELTPFDVGASNDPAARWAATDPQAEWEAEPGPPGPLQAAAATEAELEISALWLTARHSPRSPASSTICAVPSRGFT
jgi:hypothetical protein